MSPYVNRTRPRVPTELTVPMSAVSTPRARGGLCLAAGICPGWVEAWCMVAVTCGQTGAPPWISLFCTDARPGSKPRTTHPVHLWLIKCTEAGPGWSPVPARLDLCGTPLRTSLRHACDSFPARFQLVSSSVLSSVAFPVGNRKSLTMNSAEFTEGPSDKALASRADT